MSTKFFMFLLPVCLFLTLSSTSIQAQEKSQRPSPQVSAGDNMGETKISINYGSPAVKGREIWGKLVPYGKVWRTGANEATTFDITSDVKVNGQLLPAGRYALFTIPGEEEWTVIFNKDTDQWGAYNYKQDNDALRISVKPETKGETAERLSFFVLPNGQTEANVYMFWDKLAVGFQLTPAK
jgi:hypothetical protein